MLERHQDRRRQPRACRLAGDSDHGRGDAAVEQTAVGRDGVVDSRRLRMFRCEPVVDCDQPGSGATREV